MVIALVPYKDKSYIEDFKSVLGSYKEAFWYPFTPLDI